MSDRTSKQNVPERIYLGQLFRDGAYTDERRWVRAEDYDRLKAEMERLRAATVIVGELAALIPLSETIEATRTGATMVQWFKEHLRPADETTQSQNYHCNICGGDVKFPNGAKPSISIGPGNKSRLRQTHAPDDGAMRGIASEEPARELSASEAASFDKTLARSPRRVETSERPLTNCRHCDNGTAVTADGFHRISVQCTEYPNEGSSEKATQPLSDHLKAPVKAGDPCPAIDDVHTEHQGKCVYCGAPMAQVNAAESTEERRPTGQCSWGCYYASNGRLVRDSACTVHGASSEKASEHRHTADPLNLSRCKCGAAMPPENGTTEQT